MEPRILVTTTLLLLLGAATSAKAENPEQLRQFLNTGRCRSCDLSYVNLAREDLSNADLVGANLQGANLSDANLTNVDLSNANLQDADLNRSILTGAILQGSNLRGTILANQSNDRTARNRQGWGRQTQQVQSPASHRWRLRSRSNRPSRNDDYQSQNIDRNSQTYETELRHIYQEVTNRQISRRDLKQYGQSLGQGRSIADIRREMVQSPEGRAALNGVYREVLGRNIDASGLKTWTDYLNRGRSLTEVYREVSRSPEARDRR
jgi:hypothetical protein